VDAYLRQHITHSADDMSLESDGGMILTGENRRTRRKTCPSATLSTINPTWIEPGANPSLRGERPATNDLRHGMAIVNANLELPPTACNVAILEPRTREAFPTHTRQMATVHHSAYHMSPFS
jgi:hypothetical protein